MRRTGRLSLSLHSPIQIGHDCRLLILATASNLSTSTGGLAPTRQRGEFLPARFVRPIFKPRDFELRHALEAYRVMRSGLTMFGRNFAETIISQERQRHVKSLGWRDGKKRGPGVG